jgi:hypothetical protein
VPATLLALGFASSAGAADVYNACFKTTTSRVRSRTIQLNSTPICRTSETMHTWNEGTFSCAPEEFSGTAAASTFAVLNSSCSAGKHATGASAIWHTPFDAADNGPFYILPRSDGMWTVVPYNHTGTPQDFRFFLQCCS